MLRSKKLANIRDITHKLDVVYMHVFNNPDGAKVLEDLVKIFLPEKLSTGDAHTTAIRVGESNPIRYIQRRVENGVDGKSVR